MAYLASPLWLTLLVLTSLEAARAALIPWDYFADATSFGPAGRLPGAPSCSACLPPRCAS